MSKAFMTKRKTVTAVIAVAMTAVILFGGTFAWQSISQEALNEVKAVVNPGGRLHDDFVEVTGEVAAADAEGYKTMTFDKDVYVENFTSLAENGVQVFARVRLDEYMEFGTGAGSTNPDDRKDVESLVYGAKFDDKTTWATHIPGSQDDPFRDYWNWKVSSEDDPEQGSVYYMPTFNKNKDSLEADINGTFNANFTDYKDYSLTVNATETGNAIYDADNDDGTDELVTEFLLTADAVIADPTLLPSDYTDHITLKEETHTAQPTLTAYVITMAEWLERPADQKVGDFWVWDTDGWAYWANPISPQTATGVLLDEISRTETVINEDWYYGINVVAQFITKDNLGKEDGNGFYAPNAGEFPSNHALALLKAIGVDVDTTAQNDVEFENALKLGGNITVSGDMAAASAITADTLGTNFDANYAWTTGGSMTGLKDADGNLISSITTANSAYAGMFINAEIGYPNDNDGAAAAVVSDMIINGENVGYAVYVQAIDAPVTFNTVTVTNNLGGGIYAEWAGARVTINGCTVTVPTASGTATLADTGVLDWQVTAVAASNGAEVVVNGGTYTGMYAAYVYNSGGSITINGGVFNGELKVDAGELIIKGGSFSADPTAYLAEGCTAEQDASGMWIVK